MVRVAIKIVGAQGQGVNSVGEMCAKGLKRSGFCVFGYREYMSLIKGGHSSYQLDVSAEDVRSSTTRVDIVVTFNHHGLEKNLRDIKKGGILLHQTPQWKFKNPEDQAFIAEQKIRVIELPTDAILKKLKAKPILGNVLITAVVWSLLSQPEEQLRALVREQFGHKKDLLDLNFACIAEGFAACKVIAPGITLSLPKPDSKWQDQLLLTGSQAMGLGIIHAGCRVYVGYPMTPSSPILTFIADMQNETGMAVKQAEDEITAAQMMVGAMHMGTRAITATSGGGFDLMTETLSLTGITETPAVFILAQRPGPGTALPTWTAQGDLTLAVGAGHGEYTRLVMAASDTQDSFDLLPEAFNFAEEFQIPVIVLTDKHLGEALFTQPAFDQTIAKLKRGRLVTDLRELAQLKPADRYDPAAGDGVSKRWLPGSEAATFCAQGDEHGPDGSVTEDAENARQQMEKRLKKMAALKAALPEPLYVGPKNPETLIVSWGSNRGVIFDVLESAEMKKKNIGYLHYQYLWPLKTESFEMLSRTAKRTVFIECNHGGQLASLLKLACGRDVTQKILKFDGRPFFFEELREKLLSALTPNPSLDRRGA
ncbi:MAG: 2-oxoacid:acceptor oxidoreductase subunit alpha [Candidatus Peribacteraceae bacterium]|nr:2-oxoacid:acceptor oxidoreductase subunit alpha [Candidatus Peribacteraceae bacterium]MDD5739580.1 2-oxoacid:acceptor oxidoreductase subunit alpha [Candidatus Peribacteraceae bacterium]